MTHLIRDARLTISYYNKTDNRLVNGIMYNEIVADLLLVNNINNWSKNYSFWASF